VPGLSRQVRDHRFARMQQLMRQEGYDALAFTGADWFEWVSNHPIADQAFERPYLVIVTADGRSFALSSELGSRWLADERARGEAWLDFATHYAESPDNTNREWTAANGPHMFADALRRTGLARARIGIDSISSWLSEAVRMLSDLTLVRASTQLRELRRVKHAEEIATMRRCAALTQWALGVYREELWPGRLLAELDFLVSARLAAEAGRRCAGEVFTIRKLTTTSGPTSAYADDGRRADAAVVGNTIAGTTLATRLNGLALELARPWLIGTPAKRVVELFEWTLSAHAASIDALVAGRPISGVHRAARLVFERAGCAANFVLRAGHGIGVIQHDFPVDVPFDDRPLVEHEVYAVEPSLHVGGLGVFRFADTVAVGAAAPDALTTAESDRVALSVR
jgi:Xaa-Pro aminopeptidase